MTNLKSLTLYSYQINDISALSGLTNLQSLWLSDNQKSVADKQSLKDALPKCAIYYLD